MYPAVNAFNLPCISSHSDGECCAMQIAKDSNIDGLTALRYGTDKHIRKPQIAKPHQSSMLYLLMKKSLCTAGHHP